MLNEVFNKAPQVVYVSPTANDDLLSVQLSNFLKVRTQPNEPSIGIAKDTNLNLWSVLGVLTAGAEPVSLPSLVVNLDTLKMRPTEFLNQLVIIMEKMPTLTIGLLALVTSHDDASSDDTAPLLDRVKSTQVFARHDNFAIARETMKYIPPTTATQRLPQ
jgi:hypothetical protein